LDKYHSDDKPYWKDDDCFIRIGTFNRSISDAQLITTQKAVRDYLSQRQPVVINVSVDDVSIVLYDNSSMEEEHIKEKIKLSDFLNNPSLVKKFYQRILKEATI
jgi:hypothetical protein